eukprot:g10965.t1
MAKEEADSKDGKKSTSKQQVYDYRPSGSADVFAQFAPYEERTASLEFERGFKGVCKSWWSRSRGTSRSIFEVPFPPGFVVAPGTEDTYTEVAQAARTAFAAAFASDEKRRNVFRHSLKECLELLTFYLRHNEQSLHEELGITRTKDKDLSLERQDRYARVLAASLSALGELERSWRLAVRWIWPSICSLMRLVPPPLLCPEVLLREQLPLPPAIAASTLPSLAQGLCFGPSAFGRIERARPSGGWLELEQKEVARMVVASVPSARHLRGQRGELKVTQMLAGIHKQGEPGAVCLWTFGNASSPVNREVWPAFRFIVSEMSKLEPLHPKRVNIFTALVKACEDCQQVQARDRPCEIMHLFSGYVSQIGDSFGLDGLDAAKSDKFLPRVLEELERKKTLKSKRRFLQALVREMSVTEPHLHKRDLEANLSVEAAHRIFYDEDRAEEFKGQDPEKPEPANQYQPFLSAKCAGPSAMPHPPKAMGSRGVSPGRKEELHPAKKSVRIALNSESSVLGRRSEDEPIGMLASRTTSGGMEMEHIVPMVDALKTTPRPELPLLRSRPHFEYSFQVTEIDDYWSHSWGERAWKKPKTKGTSAMICGTLTAVAVAPFSALSLLGAFEAPCVSAGLLAFWLVLLLKRPRRTVFLDQVCINKEDEEMKHEGLLNLQYCLRSCKSMLLLWDLSYAESLLPIFEAFVTLYVTFDHDWKLFVVIACFIPYFIACGLLLLFYFASVQSLKEQNLFSVDSVHCQCCGHGHRSRSGQAIECERKMIFQSISMCFGSLEDFERYVSNKVSRAFAQRLGNFLCQYWMVVVLGAPVFWGDLDLLSNAWRQDDQLKAGLLLAIGLSWWLAIIPAAYVLFIALIAKSQRRQKRRTQNVGGSTHPKLLKPPVLEA